MKRWLLISFSIVVAFIFYGCSGKTDTADINFFKDLRSYEATVSVTFFKDKEPNTIQMQQIAQMNGNYQITVLAPEHMKGVTMNYTGGNSVLEYYPAIGKEIESPFNPVQNETLLTTLVQRCLETGTISKQEATLNGKKVFTYEIPMNSTVKYFNTEKIWIDPDKNIPLQVAILDEEGNSSIEILYDTFKMNGKKISNKH